MASNISTGITNAFGLRVKKVTREKSCYLCDADEGVYKLEREAASPEQLQFRHTVKEHAAQNGYPWLDRYRLAASGQPYAIFANELWTASSYVKGREAAFDSESDMVKVLTAVRGWHSAARGAAFNEAFASPPLTDIFHRQARELNAMAKRVRRQTRLSDFDVMFIKHVSFYAGQIKNALLLLEQSDYAEFHRNALRDGQLCHHTLKEESLTVTPQAVYITHHENAAFDTPLADMAALIRRYAARAGQNAAPARQILQAVPFTPKEMEVLYALLLFPWNFMKTAALYYSKKRTWTPGALINRMQAVLSEADYFNAYLQPLASPVSSR